MWVGDCTVAEELCMPHRKCRLKRKAQPPGNRSIRMGNGISQWHQNCRDSKKLERRVISFCKCIDLANTGEEGSLFDEHWG